MDEQTRGTAKLRVGGEMFLLISSTLVVKKCENSSHLAGDTSRQVLGRGLMRELMVVNRVLGLWELLMRSLIFNATVPNHFK